MPEPKLKQCPFCGKQIKVTRGVFNAPFYFFKCSNKFCGATISFDNMTANMNPPKAVENWNRRANENE